MVLSLLILSVVVISIIGSLLLYRGGLRRQTSLPDAAWLHDFSPEKYRPMLRLLDSQDYDWLTSQGMEKSAIRELRTERRRIFGTYLQNISRDFGKLHSAASALVLALPGDEPELAGRLLTVRVQFQRTMMLVRMNLLLHDLGLGSVDVRQLVSGIEALHQELRPMIAIRSGAAA